MKTFEILVTCYNQLEDIREDYLIDEAEIEAVNIPSLVYIIQSDGGNHLKVIDRAMIHSFIQAVDDSWK